MQKAQLLKLYEDYLKENPQNVYIKNVRRTSGGEDRVNRLYILDNKDLTEEEVPEDLTVDQVFELDEKHNHTLTWKILESEVTDEQIAAFERENHVTLPRMFREYLQGYTVLQECFYPKYIVSEDYGQQGRYDQSTGEYIDYSDEELEQDEDLVGDVQLDFYCIDNPCKPSSLSLGYFEKIKRMHLGNLDNGDMVLLDCETGEVQSWDHEMNNSWDAESREEFEEESMMGLFWFQDFDTFLEWVFGKTVYDFEQAEEEQEAFYQAHSKPKQIPPENIIYL